MKPLETKALNEALDGLNCEEEFQKIRNELYKFSDDISFLANQCPEVQDKLIAISKQLRAIGVNSDKNHPLNVIQIGLVRAKDWVKIVLGNS